MKVEPVEADFEHHVVIDGDILGTTAPLELSQLDRVIQSTTRGLVVFPKIQSRLECIRSQVIDQNLLLPATAVSETIRLLETIPDALRYFKVSIVKELTGIPLGSTVPQFIGTSTDPPAPVKSPPIPPIKEVQIKPEPSLKVSKAGVKRARADVHLRSNASKSTRTHATTRTSDITPTVPNPWEDVEYRSVECINIQNEGAVERVRTLRYTGTPFLLEGHPNWMKFADGWVRSDGSLDTSNFLRGLHDVQVPVLERNYEEVNPINTHVSLSHFVKQFWEKGKAEYYLHQWQFPLNPVANKLLCYKSEHLPVLGTNLLDYWLDAVRRDNPLQYLFMGHQSTCSRMHQDHGGLDITIAPIVGTKRVTMLHRNAGKLDTIHGQVDFHDINLDQNPMLAFIRAWQVDVKPGQILYMPDGTFHACENITACLSYHRFHVDSVNLPGFLHSFFAQDAQTIHHAEILWNATHDVISDLEDAFSANNETLPNTSTIRRQLDTVRALRHACRAISLEDAVPTTDNWEWTQILHDIDQLLLKMDPSAKTQAPKDCTTERKREKTGTKRREVNVKEEPKTTTASSRWEELNVHVGDIVGVQVASNGFRAKVQKVVSNMQLCKVHYTGWGSVYDEYLPISALYKPGKKVQYKKAPAVNEVVQAKWGSCTVLFSAVVHKVIRSDACKVHYLKLEDDWDQWLLPHQIFRNYGPDKE